MGLQKGFWMGIFILFSFLHPEFLDLRQTKNFDYDLIILTEDSLVPAFQNYINLKWKTGITTKIFGVSFVKQSFPGGDTQEKIRNFIRHYHNLGTDYFLLAGDHGVIPARFLYVPMNGTADDHIPTDFYYMCLDGNFNADGDTLYGEFNDSVDVTPDVKVGRLPVKNSRDVENYLYKLMSYMFSPYPGLNKAVFIGSDITTPGSGAQYCIAVEDSFPENVEKIEFYETTSSNNSKDEVLDTLSQGAGFVYGNLHAQSFDRMLVNFTPRRSITNYDIDRRLSNYGMPGFYDIVTCHIGGFDTDALIEHLILDSSGAVGAYATTRLNYPAITINLNRYFYGQLFSHDVTRIGDLDFLTRMRYSDYAANFINYRYVIFSYVLFGDPTLQLWQRFPSPVSVVYDTTYFDSILVITATDTVGNPIVGARVVIYSEGSFLSTGFTDDSGRAVLKVKPGSMSIFIEKKGYQNFLDSIDVAPHGPAIKFFGLRFSRYPLIPGDTVSLDVGIVNLGNDVGGNFRIEAISSDSNIQVIRSGFTVERIEPGDTILLSDSVVIAIGDSARDMEEFDIKIFCTGSDTIASDSIHGVVKRSNLRGIFIGVSGDTLLSLKVGVQNLGTLTSREFVVGLLPGNYSMIDSVVWVDSLGGFGLTEIHGLRLLIDDNFDSTIGVYVRDRFSVDTLIVGVGTPRGVRNFVFTPYPEGVRLAWEEVDGASGYAVYRSQDGRDYYLAGFVQGTSFYDSITGAVFYRIAVVDSAGFCGEPGEPVSVRSNFAIKDGFPVYAEGGVYGSPVVGEFDAAYPGKEILIASFPYGYVYLYHADGTLADGWPVFLDGEIWASPAMADIDADGEDEALIVLRSSNEVHVFNGDGTEVDGWPVHTARGTFYTPAIGDLDGDGLPEIVINDQSSDLFVFRHDGTGFRDSTGEFLNVGNWWKAGSPVIFDYDGDSLDDIGIGLYSNGHLYFSVFSGTGDTLLMIPLDSRISSPPVVGEFRRDFEGNEILINDNGTLKLFDHAGNLIVSYEGFYTAVAADVNFDGELDIVGTTDRGVRIYSSRGLEMLNREFQSVDYYLKEPVVGDVDGDRVPEILFESFMASELISVELDSSITPGFPFNLVESPGYCIPILDDIDGDGLMDIIVASTFDSVWVLETQAPFDPSRALFPVEKYDYRRTGFVEFVPTGIHQGELNMNFVLYPTVTKGMVTIETGEYPVTVTFYTTDGRVVKRFSKVASNTLKLKLDFPSGIYFYRVKSAKGIVKTGKLLLLR